MADRGRVGVLGGTFDPPHVAHLVLAEQAREQLGLGRVIWVPAGIPWRKAGRAISEAKHRVKMVELAIEGNPTFELCRVEADHEGPSYTAETLEKLGEAYGPELYFILGADALEDLPNWHAPERIVLLARLAVAGRPGASEDVKRRFARPGLAERAVDVEMPAMEVSGTDLRRRAADGRSLRYLVPEAVREYIEREGLYRGRASRGRGVE